jgi:hypothetical protein
MRKLRGTICPLVPVILVLACERSKVVPPTDSTRQVVEVSPQTTPPVAAPVWDTELGPLLLVGGDTPGTAALLSSDASRDTSSKMVGTHVTLLGRGGEAQAASLEHTAPVAEGGCAGLASWTLRTSTGAIAPWALGVIASEPAKTIAMDSVESLSQADSASLAAQAARLASTIAHEGENRFSGVPYTVLSLWRFTLAPSTHVLAANLIRRLNQEASPLEERTLVIAESDSSRTGYTPAYSERSQGPEETVESRDFVAAVQLGKDAHPVLVMARDFDDAVAYSFLERDAPGHWRLRWTSRRVRCAPHEQER